MLILNPGKSTTSPFFDLRNNILTFLYLLYFLYIHDLLYSNFAIPLYKSHNVVVNVFCKISQIVCIYITYI